ncbi:hypothetical protein ACLM5H_16735 [Fredinandcohnia humi]
MNKKKWIGFSGIILILFVFSIILWGYNHNIINGDYSKITIMKDGNVIEIIDDQKEVNLIVDQINNSPRSFHTEGGWKYDYLEHVILSFEGDEEKHLVGVPIKLGNVVTKYWEIETEFDFIKEMAN